MALISLAEAAKLVGKSKPTLWRAHKRGDLSMDRNAQNEWRVDTSELFRVYPPQAKREETQQETVASRDVTHEWRGFEAENALLKQNIETLEASLKRADETLVDLRTRLDESERERREATNTIRGLLTHTQPHKTSLRTSVAVLLAILLGVVAIAAWRFFPMPLATPPTSDTQSFGSSDTHSPGQ